MKLLEPHETSPQMKAAIAISIAKLRAVELPKRRFKFKRRAALASTEGEKR